MARASRRRATRRKGRRATSALLAAWGLGLGGCAGLSLDELDELNRSVGAETILIRERFTVYSPYSALETRRWAELVEREIGLVARLFAQDVDDPIAVLLEPVGDWGAVLAAEGDEASVQFVLPHGLLGWATGDTVVVRVSPMVTVAVGGRELSGTFGADMYRETLRHELAHAFARRAGLSGDRWFGEGLAELAETLAAGDGGDLRLGPPGDELRRLGHLSRAERSLRELLDWSREDPSLETQPPTRALAHSFVRFLLEGVDTRGWPAALRRIEGLSRAQLLAREEAWQSWLDGLAAEAPAETPAETPRSDQEPEGSTGSRNAAASEALRTTRTSP